MQMTNSELAEQLNNLWDLQGTDAVTVNVIRQWIAWDVLPKAQVQGRMSGRGPIWIRDGRSFRRANRLAKLRKMGVRREHALIFQAYVEWGHSDFSRVSDALSHEFLKWREQLHRRHITFLGNDGFSNLSAGKKRAIANQIGPLDSLFAGTQFEQSPELHAIWADLARTGEGNSNVLIGQLIEAFRQMYPANDPAFAVELLFSIVATLPGLTGSPDEIGNSGESTIANATERQFRVARIYAREYLKMLRVAGRYAASGGSNSGVGELMQKLHLLAPQISIGPWLTFAFAQLLHYVFHRTKFQRNCKD